jgi:hypothetical protein
VSRPSLDWTDAAEVRQWLAGLRQSFDDMDGVALDMLKSPRERELGPVLHAQKYAEARETILHTLAYAEAPEPDDGEPSDPAGNGGSPAH